MLVSPKEPFVLVFSLYQHEFLGYLIEPFVVKLSETGNLTLQSQNISATNVRDFKAGIDNTQIKLVELASKIQQDNIIRKFGKGKKFKKNEFFHQTYNGNEANKPLIEAISLYIENYKQKIFKDLKGQQVYVMGTDGYPCREKIEIVEETPRVYFHFNREPEKTIYFPVIRCGEERVKFQFQNGKVINDFPAILLIKEKMYIFDDHVDGKKLKPFLNKSNIEIPKSIEDKYYKNFIVPLIANFNVYADGFEIIYEKEEFLPFISITELSGSKGQTSLFDHNEENLAPEKVILDLILDYSGRKFRYGPFNDASYVFLEKTADSWKFYKLKRDLNAEEAVVQTIKSLGLDLRKGQQVLPKNKALKWLNENLDKLKNNDIQLKQNKENTHAYFIGYSQIEVEAKEGNDWFDIYTKIRFGEFEIPFKEIRYYILNKIKEFKLPDGQFAIIPDEWFNRYSELFENIENEDQPKLKKHFVGLLSLLNQDGIVHVMAERKLSVLHDFEEITSVPLPKNFVGELRPYQKAGYDWLNFLNEYHFGGCLADDMGLGKTVTTLAFLQKLKEDKVENPSLLVLPTSLIYNWVKEASKFTPKLKAYVHYGSQREKDSSIFGLYDLIITSYGIMRMDINFLRLFKFEYAILDESQSIKNPNSANFGAAMNLNSRNRLILTGTPLENSITDLWSQMTFINPGLLKSLNSFKKKYQIDIEKQRDETAINTLSAKIKPFMLRRNKRQVAKDLPEKIESVVYCQMTEEQEKIYEETKSYVRNKILEAQKTTKQTSILILQGLSKLRQIANHPAMVSLDYQGGSGKADEILDKIIETVAEKSKTLVFSQFVKHLSRIAVQLDKEQIPYLYLDGSTRNRMELVDRFQNTSNEYIFLISLKAGGVGLNLTAATNVFILDPWWNPAIEAQAIDRAHRIGQTNTVFTYKFISQNTIEEKILELQNEKKQLFEDIIIEEESFFKALGSDDILKLLD